MIVTVLLLDDDAGFTEDLKINLENLDSNFYKNLETDIVKIIAKTSSNTEDAINMLTQEQIDLFVIDIELGTDEQGHEFYEDLFVKGIVVPSIALSAVVNTPKLRKEILDTGVAMIVKKFKSYGKPIEERVAEAICQVLDSPEQKLLQLQTNVEHYEIENKQYTYNKITKSGQEWIDALAKNEINTQDASEIQKIIMKDCIEQSKFEQRS